MAGGCELWNGDVERPNNSGSLTALSKRTLTSIDAGHNLAQPPSLKKNWGGGGGKGGGEAVIAHPMTLARVLLTATRVLVSG